MKRRLDAGRRVDFTRRAELADRSATQIVSRMGSRLAETCFGAKDAQAERRLNAIVDSVVAKFFTSSPKPTAKTSPPKAAPSKETETPVSINPRSTFKRMSVSFGIEENARRLDRIA